MKDIIAEAVERMRIAEEAESHNRAEAIDDLEFLRGNQWPPEIKSQREKEGRPCLTVNTLPTFLAQVTNDIRQNKIAIKIHPVDSKADPETAKVYQGVIRHIEYDSNADVAYHMAAASAAACSFGYFRLLNEYESRDSFNQTLKFAPIRNPFTVYADPFGIQPDGSDRNWYVICDDVPKAEFKRDYPDATAADFESVDGHGDNFRGWISEETVRVAEYYRYEDRKDTLCLLEDGTTKWEDELRDGDVCTKKRKSNRRIVKWSKLTAKEVLEETEIPCEWIPVFPVYGTEVDIDGKVYRSSLIRAAKDPARMYNVWMTSATEEIGMRTRTPWVMAEGQDEGYEAQWSTANTVTRSRLIYKPTPVGGQLAPPPQRQPMADVPVGVLTMAQHARDDIKASMGLFDSSMGARGSATSGKQEIAQQRQGQITNFHFADNLAKAVRHAGRCLLSMIPRVFDTPRVVKILGDDESLDFAEVNKPLPMPEVDPKTGAIRRILNDLTAGRYDLTVSVGPAYATMRQEAQESMRDMAQSWPKLMDVAGDKMVKAMNWPDGDVIADRLKKTIPPDITQGENKDEPAPEIPPQIQQQLQQYDAALADAMEQIKAMQSSQQQAIQQAQVKAEADVEIAKIKAMADIEAKTQVAAISAQHEAMNRPPESSEPEKEDQGMAMLAQAVAMLAAPKRKVMEIQAPSGGVYVGTVVETTEGATGATE